MSEDLLTFTVPGPPVPKARARKGKGGHWYTPTPTRKYEAAIKQAAALAIAEWQRVSGWTRKWKTDAIYSVEVVIYFGDRRRRDGDNVFKSVADAANGILWDDDEQIREHHVSKQLDRENPRAEVTVSVLPMIVPRKNRCA